MKKLIFLSIIVLGMIFISCKKDFDTYPINPTMSDLNVPSNFDWKTTKDYTFEINSEKTGLLLIQSEKGVNYLKIFVKNGTNNIKVTLPSYESKVYLMLNGEKKLKNL